MIKKIILGVAALVAIVSGGLFLKSNDGALGAISSPNIQSPYITFGGVRHWAARTTSLSTATSTVCAIQSPVATSTIMSASMQLTASTSASVLRISKATTRYATTTTLAASNLAANVGGIITATTTTATDDAVINPSNWVVFSQEGGTGVFSPTAGSCQATFIQI